MLKLKISIFRNFYKLLIDDELRSMFCFARYKASNAKTFQKSKNILDITIPHNSKGLSDFFTDFKMQRSKRLIFSVLADECINKESKFLIIGPRTENEIFFLFALGFLNVKALDLISYSDLVTCGDMHSIPFPNESFDAIICGWALSYSTNPAKAMQEMLKKCKSGGPIS